MNKIIDSISVFFPTYNEGGNIENTVLSAKKVLEEISSEWEIIIVNDGSTDNSLTIANKLSKDDNRIRIISHSKNRGYGASLKSGFYNAKYPWICFSDSDGQFNFAEIKKFILKQKEEKADLVIGYYLGRKVSSFTIITSKVWEIIVFILFGMKVKDTDCGFKLISKKVIDTIDKLEAERGAFISSELLIKAKKKGFKITQVGVRHYPRIKGKGTGRSVKVIIKSFIDLARLWIKLNLFQK
jgi:glycosyltransferase involved in cell wall biosynthesis